MTLDLGSYIYFHRRYHGSSVMYASNIFDNLKNPKDIEVVHIYTQHTNLCNFLIGTCFVPKDIHTSS